jgi:RimJ/RimL family protein N-acetyltransferase
MLQEQTVRLRALEHTDLPQVVAWFNDPAVRLQVARSSPLSLTAEERAYEALLKSTTEVQFLIEVLDGADRPPRAAGVCGLHRIDWRNRGCALGIVIGEDVDRGMGHGTAAVRALVRHAFRDLGLHRVELEVYPDNVRARRCYEKVGFVVEGVRRQAMFKDGAFRDNVLMGVLAPAWLAADLASEVPPPSTAPAGRGTRRRR